MTLNWIVNERKIAPHIPVIDKSKREDGSLTVETEPSTYPMRPAVTLCVPKIDSAILVVKAAEDRLVT